MIPPYICVIILQKMQDCDINEIFLSITNFPQFVDRIVHKLQIFGSDNRYFFIVLALFTIW